MKSDESNSNVKKLHLNLILVILIVHMFHRSRLPHEDPFTTIYDATNQGVDCRSINDFRMAISTEFVKIVPILGYIAHLDVHQHQSRWPHVAHCIIWLHLTDEHVIKTAKECLGLVLRFNRMLLCVDINEQFVLDESCVLLVLFTSSIP